MTTHFRVRLSRMLAAGVLATGLLVNLSASAGDDLLFSNGYEPNLCVAQWPFGSIAEWSSMFPGSWPTFNFTARMSIPANGYLALRFTASQTAGQFGTLYANDGFPGANGTGQVSISRTPGCFDPAFLGANCLSQVTGAPGVSWIVAASSLSCSLQPGASYYVNFTMGNSAASLRDVANVMQ